MEKLGNFCKLSKSSLNKDDTSYNSKIPNAYANYNDDNKKFTMDHNQNYDYIYKPTKKLFNQPTYSNYDDLMNFIYHDSHLWCYKNQIRTNVGVMAICLNIGKQLPYRKRLLNTTPMIIGGVAPMAYEGHLSAVFPPFFEKELREAYLNIFSALQPRVRYILNIDPTENSITQIYKNCNKLCNNERIFFYYNGYGVPDPEPDGNLYLSSYNNRGFDTFEKISLKQLYQTENITTLTVLDCSFSEYVLESLINVSITDENDNVKNVINNSSVFLGATKRDQLLPLISELPTDIFTMCLTAPLEIATILYQFHSSQKNGIPFTMDNIKKIPGVLTNRNTLLGEINWIYIAIVDTIAYVSLPLEKFLKLYRGDLLLATFMRNFLLAIRLLAPFGCNPISYPKLPNLMHHHYLWQLWDYHFERTMHFINQPNSANITRIHNDFFINQLRSFNHWLRTPGNEDLTHPEYLTQALQFLLGQSLRSMTLNLMCHFFDLGLWAIKQALSVGMFTYLVKLFDETISNENLATLDFNKIKQSLFLWCKLTFFEPHYRIELLSAKKYHFFIFLLRHDFKNNAVDFKIIIVYIITRLLEDPIRRDEAMKNYGNALFLTLCEIMNQCHYDLTNGNNDFPKDRTQTELKTATIINSLPLDSFDNITENENNNKIIIPGLMSHLLLLWTYLCFGVQCENNITVQQKLLRQNVIPDLKKHLYNNDPQMRAATICLLGNLILHSNDISNTDQSNDELIISLILDMMDSECNTMSKKEIMIAIFKFVSKYHDRINMAAFELSSDMNVGIIQFLFDPNTLQKLTHDRIKKLKKLFHSTLLNIVYSDTESIGNIYMRVFKCAMRLLIDSTHEIIKTTRLFMAAILPFELCVSDKDVVAQSILTLNANYPISNHSINFKRRLFDKLPDSDPLSTISNINICSPTSADDCTNPHVYDWNSIFAGKLPSSIRYQSNSLTSDLIFRCSLFFTQPIMHSDTIHYKQHKEIFKTKSQCESNWETFKRCISTPKLDKSNFSILTHLIYDPHPTYSTIKFNPYKSLLYLAQHNVVNIINWSSTSEIFRKIVNHPNKMVDITAIEIINCEYDNPFLLTGSDDGVVKIWSLQNTKNELNCISGQVSSWKAVPFFIHTHNSSPTLVSAWNQRISTLCVSGWSEHVYYWDLNVERQSGSIMNSSSSPITSLSFFEMDYNTLVCTTYNGCINIIDSRNRSNVAYYCDIRPKDFQNTRVPISSAYCKAFPSITNNYEIKIVNSSGSILLYDIRQQRAISHHAVAISNLASCDYQPYHNCLAYQSLDGNYNILADNGDIMFKGNIIKTFTKDKSTPFLAAKFHPFMSVLALYTDDGSLNIVYTDEQRDQSSNTPIPTNSAL